MIPDTASSRAAISADVHTDRTSARWKSGCWVGSRGTSVERAETTSGHTCPRPLRSINIHFAARIPDVINDVSRAALLTVNGVPAPGDDLNPLVGVEKQICALGETI